MAATLGADAGGDDEGDAQQLPGAGDLMQHDGTHDHGDGGSRAMGVPKA